MKLDTFSREGQLGRAVGKSDMKLERMKLESSDRSWKIQDEVGK